MPNGDMILLDGHNRFEIAAKHGGIHFEVKKLHFTDYDRERAIVWICENQLGRRNLPLPDKVLLEDRKRNEIAKIAKAKQGERTDLSNIPKKSWESQQEKRKASRENETDYKIAKAAGTSEDTVRKVREINEKSPTAIQRIRDGKQSINGAWLEIKERERKQEDFSAKARLEEAKERHEDFQNAKTVTMQDIAQDKKDTERIALGKRDELENAIKKILFFKAAMSGGDMSFSIINEKTIGKERLQSLINDLTLAISALTLIRNSLAEGSD